MYNFSPGHALSGASVTPLAVSPALEAGKDTSAILPGTAGKLTYIEGFDLLGMGPTGVTVTGLASGTLTFGGEAPKHETGKHGEKHAEKHSPAAKETITVGNGYSWRPPTPLPAAALETAIAVNVPGSGAVIAYGFQA